MKTKNQKTSISNDPIMLGAIAGLIGAIIQVSFTFIMKSIGITDRIFMDFGQILILGQHKPNLAGFFIGLISHLINAIFCGVIFSYIMKFGKKNYILLKGTFFGLIIWMFSLGIATLYKISLFEVIEINVAYVLLIGAAIYGFIMSLTYKYLISK